MKELKTLKDFGATIYDHIGDRVYTDLELKEEAIKWVKALERGHSLSYKEQVGEGIEEFIDSDENSEDYIINWIKHFFNITDDDLR